MKIGIDCRMIKATGIGRYVSNLIEEISKIDNKNEYILFFKEGEFNSFQVPGSNFRKVLANFHWYGISEQIKFPPLIKKYNLDLMHFPHFNAPLFYRGNFVVNIHDLTLHHYKTIRASTKSYLTYSIKNLFYKVTIKNSIRRALKIFAISEFTKKDVINTFKVPEIKILLTYPGGPSLNLVKKNPDTKVLKKIETNPPFILYVGNAYPHKNLENLIKALNYLPSEVNLVLVGEIDEFYKRLKKNTSELNIQKRVKFTGFLTDEELVFLYKNASVFAFPSFNEGFGLPALEAMAFGLPVVSSSSSCLPEILGEGALYFNPKDPKDIAKKIEKVLDDNDLKDNLVRNGYDQIKKYSWKRMAEQTLGAYKEILDK